MESSDIIVKLKERKKALEQELSKVEKALVALGDGPAPAKKPRQARATAPEGSTPTDPTTQESVLRRVTELPRTAKEIAFSGGMDPSKTSVVLSALASGGKVVRTGEKGSYTYALPSTGESAVG